MAEKLRPLPSAGVVLESRITPTRFDGSASSDLDGDQLSYDWDFGDGATLMGEQQPTHTYRQAGVYRVRLTIENDFGRSEAVWDVTVGQPPAAEMVLGERTAVGQPLTGQAAAADSATRFLWDMGDGRRHEGATVSHLYRRAGDYYVTLVADNGFGQTQMGRWVRVDGGQTSLFLPLTTFQSSSGVAGLSADMPAVAELDPVATSLSQAFVLQPIAFPTGTTPAEQLYAYLNAARSQFGLPPLDYGCLLYTSPSPRDGLLSRMPSSA